MAATTVLLNTRGFRLVLEHRRLPSPQRKVRREAGRAFLFVSLCQPYEPQEFDLQGAYSSKADSRRQFCLARSQFAVALLLTLFNSLILQNKTEIL